MSSRFKKQLLANCVSRLNFLRLHVGEKHNSITLSLKRMEEYGSTCNWRTWTLCNFGFSGSRFHELWKFIFLGFPFLFIHKRGPLDNAEPRAEPRASNNLFYQPGTWAGLESLAAACLDFPFPIMKLVGNYFNNMPQLKVMLLFKFNAVCARGIVAYTPKLKDSEYSGYSYICEQLGESIIAQASQLKEFLVCPGQLCDKCKGGNGIAADRCKFACLSMDQLTERVNMSELSASEG